MKERATVANSRIHAFDMLRAAMMFLGIIIHSLDQFPDLNYIDEKTNRRILSIIATFIQSFRMPLFFFLSGFFCYSIYKKTGLRLFVQTRLQRIFLPLVAALIIIVPVYGYFMNVLGIRKSGAGLLESFRIANFFNHSGSIIPSPVHLWFLYYLFLYVLLAALVILLLRFFRKSGFCCKHLIASLSSMNSFFILFLFTSLSYFATFITNFDPVAFSFKLNFPFFCYYLLFFLHGWLFSQFKFSIHYSVKIAAALTLVGFSLLFLRSVIWRFADATYYVIPTLSATIMAWAFVLGFLRLSLLIVQKGSPILQYLADSSYWVYLVHYPILILTNILILNTNSLVIYLLKLLIVFAVSVSSYHWWVRFTVIGKFLNGKKYSKAPIFGGLNKNRFFRF